MRTILITGGTNGIGKGVAMHCLKKGDRVIVVGNSSANGDIFYNEAKQLGADKRAVYLQANLSLIKENRRIIEEVQSRFQSLDIAVFCAAKNSKAYTETKEGIELVFALSYLSRFILSYGLTECMEKAEKPVIVNVCGSGMKGEVNWNDLQHKNNFDASVMFHSSRLNDLLGVAFAQRHASKVKYILYNPWAVQTPGMMETLNTPLSRLVYKFIGKPVDKAIVPLTELLDNPPAAALSAYRERKELALSLPSYNQENAEKLYNITSQLLK
jgi:hypothetical protein